MTTADLKAAVEAWDADADTSMVTTSRDRMIDVAVSVLSRLPGVRKVVLESGTPGSDYLAVVPDHDEACDVTVRLSNHARKPNSHLAPAWSFEAGDSIEDHERGIAAVARAVRERIEECR